MIDRKVTWTTKLQALLMVAMLLSPACSESTASNSLPGAGADSGEIKPRCGMAVFDASDASCQAQADDRCCGQQTVCARNPSCKTTLACITACTSPRATACVSACRAAEDATSGLAALETCLSNVGVVTASCAWP